MAVQISGNDITVPRDGSFTRNVTIGGTLTYEDVTNIDSVGLVTARNGIEIGARPGVAASISVDGNMIVSGISTVGELISSYGTFVRNVNDNGLTIAGGSASNSGANVTVYGGSHGSYPDVVRFRIDGSEKARIDGSGRLLLGTTTEGYASADDLTVATSGATGITIRSGTASGGTVAYSDGTSGDAEYRGYLQYDHNVDGLKIGTAGAERVRIDSSGRVLIGSTAARSESNGFAAPLQVEGTNTATSSVIIARNSANASSSQLIFQKSRGTSVGSNTVIQSGDAVGTIIFEGSDGTNTDSLASIVGACDGTPGNNDVPGRLVFSTTADGAATPTERLRIKSNGQIVLGSDGTNSELTFTQDGTSGTQLNATTTGSGGYNILSINSSTFIHKYGGNERFRIDSSGRLLVGTTSARNAFAYTTSAGIQAEGAYNQGSISSTNTENSGNTCAFVSAKIRGTGAVSGGDIVGSHDFQAFEGTAFRTVGRMDCLAINSGGISNNLISGDIRFVTRVDAQTPHETLRLSHARLAYFGCTTTPSSSVAGASIDCDPADLPVFIKTSSRQHGANAYTHYQMFTSNGVAGNILCSGTTTSYNSGSDYRLKENETAITDGITRIKQLKPYKFNWKHSPTADKVDGFFAHEVSSVVPEAISGEKDAVATEANVKSGLAENVGDMITQQIDQSKLVPLLTAALQEAITEIETLKSRLDTAGL